MKYAVTGQAFNRSSGRAVGPSRVEVVDTRSNIIFSSCKTILDVKHAYESFWNDLNPRSAEVVFVSQVVCTA